MFDQLIKIANILDTIGTPEAIQVSEGIDVAIDNAVYKMAEFDDSLPVKVLAMLNSTTSRIADLRQRYTAIKMLSGKLPEQYSERVAATAKNGLELLSRLTVDQTLLNELTAAYYNSDEFKANDPESGLHTRVIDSRMTEDNEDDSSYDKSDSDILSAPNWKIDSSSVVEDLIKIADLFDSEGLYSAAALMDQIIVEAYPNPPDIKRVPREKLYDSATNNAENIGELVRKEVEENRKQHHVETYRKEAPAHTRYSPELPGVMMSRISDGVYQDVLTKKIYDFGAGWKGDDGVQHAGGSVRHQTPQLSQYVTPSQMFETRIELNKKRQ